MRRDGDDEDEYQWLEGPYLQDDLTIKDLLDRRRCESRTKRRRRGGKSELRNDEELDQRDNEGNLLIPTIPSLLHKSSEASICPNCELGFPHLRKERSVHQRIKAKGKSSSPERTSPCPGSPVSPIKSGNKESQNRRQSVSPRKEDKSPTRSNTMMMVKEATRKEEAPLHDMTCIGIDTCSARSISCRKDDFLDLEIADDKDDHLRGIGGNNGVAGKGCLVFYVKDSNGKIKAILEPKGFYLKDPPAQFRILGQQRMKHKGLCATQDYDDAGMDILKCKRSGSILPLTEGRGLLLLKTFLYTPTEELKEQLRSYVIK